MKRLQTYYSKIYLITILTILLSNTIQAEPPVLRQQILLNGNWTTENSPVQIPNYFGEQFTDTHSYIKEVTVPENWSDKIYCLEFLSVIHHAAVFVNDEQLAEHWGGWSPFYVDITGKVKPGETFQLRVDVSGTDKMKGPSGNIVWAHGMWLKRAGITDDVFLRAYGQTSIRDAFIKTSVSNKSLTVDYTLKNSKSTRQSILLEAEVIDPETHAILHHFAKKINLSAQEEKVVSVGSPWENPELYWPDRPRMYHLKSKISINKKIIDEETRRFGFREVSIRGNQIYWNNVRINLFGDYQTFADTWYGPTHTIHTKENFASTADEMKAMNIRCVRWHHNPVPAYILDICDEKGLLVASESPNWARHYQKNMTDEETEMYVSNFIKWAPEWIKNERNHPSIYVYNVTNEKTHSFSEVLTAEECRQMGLAIRQTDPTRFCNYEGDIEAAEELFNYHYPEGYDNQPSGSIYSWGRFVKPNQPTGSGELLHTKKGENDDGRRIYNCERNKWWLGIWLRGLRYTNWTDVRPACFYFASVDLKSCDPRYHKRGENLKNAYAPVALFDKAYDDLGIKPYVTNLTPGGTLPVLTTGNEQNRTLILYNDEFRDENVKMRVSFVVDGKTILSTEKETQLALGGHKEIGISFALPEVSGDEVVMVLETFKGERQTFQEERRFKVFNDDIETGSFIGFE